MLALRPLRRSVLLCTLTLSALAGVSGCGTEDCHSGAEADASVSVHPRLVMDGLVDLKAREQGHVQITEVVFHAPEVEREDALGDEPLTGPGVGDNLVFRYAIGADNGLGDILGGERRWQLGADGELKFRFAPAGDDDVEALSLSTGVDLGDLVGQTAYVRGTIAVPSSAVRGFACGADLDGDPDTSPASCGGLDDEAETDPDTSPADGAAESETDPDTSPAHGDAESDSDPDTAPADGASASDSDPDTSPAEGDPDTSPAKQADGDPDTSPARGDAANTAQRRDDSFETRPNVRLGDARTLTHVPFVLVINDTFTLRRPVGELRVEELSAGEVLPIDLHVDMDELFSPAQVEALDKVARAGVSSTVVVEGTVAGAVQLELDAKAVKKVAKTPGIRVTGDLR